MTLTQLLARPRYGIFRHAPLDALLVGFALAHGVLLLTVPSVALIAVGLWWNANTVSHNFIHLPFFRSHRLNALLSVYLSVLLGFPQTFWRQRHLAHHSNVSGFKFQPSGQLVVETASVLALWTTILAMSPALFFIVYLPGLLIGLGLCQVQGHFEHVRGTTSHYGWLYNLLFFNDGFHVEHHERPGEHWTRLPRQMNPSATASHWPPVFRWLEMVSLESLERLVLRLPSLRRLVLRNHERAFRALLPEFTGTRKVGIVGGGLFPRTALLLQKLLPEAELVVIDRNAANLRTAQKLVRGNIEFVHACYDSSWMPEFDLLVIPLTYAGNREAIYRHPPAASVVVHDWLWKRRGKGVVVSLLLLKRLNLVQQSATFG